MVYIEHCLASRCRRKCNPTVHVVHLWCTSRTFWHHVVVGSAILHSMWCTCGVHRAHVGTTWSYEVQSYSPCGAPVVYIEYLLAPRCRRKCNPTVHVVHLWCTQSTFWHHVVVGSCNPTVHVVHLWCTSSTVWHHVGIGSAILQSMWCTCGVHRAQFGTTWS